MKEIRIHARAGQGAITTAAILGDAYATEGKYAYAFPHFGAARMGAPMNAFLRVDEKEIRERSQIYEPDYLLVVDSTLLQGEDVFSGFKKGGVAIINGKERIKLPSLPERKIYLVPGNKIALEVIGRPLGNTALLGAFARATGEIKFSSLEKAIRKRFSGKIADKNVEAAKRGYEWLEEEKDVRHTYKS